jgi:CBS domain containing-hemolysin-like protein
MHELKERLQITDLEIGNVDTLSGYIVQKLTRWPRVGDTLTLGQYQVKVVAVDQNRQVGQVLITNLAGDDKAT